jgi:hypothetical protein
MAEIGGGVSLGGGGRRGSFLKKNQKTCGI